MRKTACSARNSGHVSKLVLFDQQQQIWDALHPDNLKVSKYRIIVFVGGIQCGKTMIGSACTTRAAFQNWSPEKSIIMAAPTYPILSQATIQKFLGHNNRFGKFNKQEHIFRFPHGPTVYARSATKPESMEGISDVVFVWLDEGGLVPLYFFENCMGRAARLQAPILITTTPYSMGWLAKLVDDALKGKRDDVLVVQLRSVDSPYFPRSEYERQEKLLDPRRFAMKYKGQFGKMQGLVYPEVNVIQAIPMPPGTEYYAGVDWGYTDPFAIVDRALTPSKVHYRVGEFVKTEMICSDIIKTLKARHAIYKYKAILCDPSRPDYIGELQLAGLPAEPANNELQLGIDRHRAIIRDNRYFMFERENPTGIDEYNSYHYPEPEELGFDDKQKEADPVDSHNHTMDGERYVTNHLEKDVIVDKSTPRSPSVPGQLSNDPRKRIEQLKKGTVRRNY